MTSARGERASEIAFSWPNAASRCDRGPLGDVRATPRAYPRRPREREAAPQTKAQTKSAFPSSTRPSEASRLVRGEVPSRRGPPKRLFRKARLFLFRTRLFVANPRPRRLTIPITRVAFLTTARARDERASLSNRQKRRVSLRTLARAFFQPYAARFRAASQSKSGAFAHWAACFFLVAGATAEYALALLPVAAAGASFKPLGALIGGGLGVLFVGGAGYVRAYVFESRNALADHFFLGALVAATPAAHAASALVTAADFRGASLAYGPDGMGMADAAEALASDAGSGRDADAFALREPEVLSVFRFDLMGQAHATTPLPDATHGHKAGKLEEGTFCAVPVVGANWTIADPVPMWYVCENDWRLFVDCEEAYRGTYDRGDWYGKDRLRDCLRRPEALVAAYDVAYPFGAPPPSPPPPPPPPPTFNATSVNGTSVNGTSVNATSVNATSANGTSATNAANAARRRLSSRRRLTQDDSSLNLSLIHI